MACTERNDRRMSRTPRLVAARWWWGRACFRARHPQMVNPAGPSGRSEAPGWPLTQWTEADLLAYVRRTARLLQWRTYHTLWSVGSDGGMPDLVLVRPPRVLFCELKTERGRLTKGRLHPTNRGRRTRWTDGQLEWLADLARCPGVETYLWRPSDAQEIAQILGDGAHETMPCVMRLQAVLAAAEGGTDASSTAEGVAPKVPDPPVEA